MATIKEAAKVFLSEKTIAVVGVSRNPKMAANFIYRKLRNEGYKVFAVNPNATIVEEDTCYSNLKEIPDKPGAVVIVTKPDVTEQVVRECAELGIAKVWMHKGPDAKTASVSEEAVVYCRKNNIAVIPGACPMMYCDHVDFGHRIMRWIQNLTGGLPKEV